MPFRYTELEGGCEYTEGNMERLTKPLDALKTHRRDQFIGMLLIK